MASENVGRAIKDLNRPEKKSLLLDWIITIIEQYCTWTRPTGAGGVLFQMTLLLYEVCDLNKSLNNGKFWAGCQNVSHFNTLDTRYQIRSSCVLSSIRLIYSKAFLPSKCVYLMQEQRQNEMYCILELPISSTYLSNKLISHICTSVVSSWLGFILI